MEGKLLQAVDRVIKRLGEWGLMLSGILILIMSFLSTYGVARRYLFNSPEPYSYEWSTILLVACVVFAIAGLQYHERHLRVDFVISRFSKTVQHALCHIFTPVLALFYVVILSWKSWENTLYSWSVWETSQSVWEEPLFPIKLMVPVGMALLCLVLALQLVRGCFGLISADRSKSN